MTDAVLHPDEIEGWRGEIHDGEVVKDSQAARSEEEDAKRADEARGGRHTPRDRVRRGEGDRAPRRAASGDERPSGGPARRSGAPRRSARRGNE
jgi:hypothetical protein